MPAGYYKNGIKMTPPSRKGVKDTPKTREKKVIAVKKQWQDGERTISSNFIHKKPHSEESKKKMSLAHKGNVKSLETRKKLSDALKGDKSYLWKGGKTALNTNIRHSLEYRLWRESVFERDNYTCVWCGAKSSKNNKVVLNADHIKPFAYYPELRFAIDNGRTLCIGCHKTTDTYLKSNNIEK